MVLRVFMAFTVRINKWSNNNCSCISTIDWPFNDKWMHSLLTYCPFAEMSRFSLDNNNFPYDNNVLVLDMVLGSLWGAPQPINWDNVAKLVPGFTPREVTKTFYSINIQRLCNTACDLLQCSHRFEELKLSGGFPHMDNQCNTLREGDSSPAHDTFLDAGDVMETGSGCSRKVTGQ